MSATKTKIVHNACFGGYSLSQEAVEMMAAMGDQEAIDELQRKPSHSGYYLYYEYDQRYNKNLVAVVEALGDRASGRYASLAIAEIEGDAYRIDEYDGSETVVTPDVETWITIKRENNV